MPLLRTLPPAGWVVLLLALSACQSDTITQTVRVPAVEEVAIFDQTLNGSQINRLIEARARLRAQSRPGASVWFGSGLSMAPLIPPDAWVIVEPIPYERLEPGMAVLYQNRAGRRVAHAILRHRPDGWLLAGVNNQSVDAERLTPANYVGVVTMAVMQRRSG